mmetsp:Transcript_29225/g.66221  ORF Transcript_29225/g.66221 Transcript_29225/m.66221 type:complete len:231 (-) Transcript_29225:38-730(-)
MHHSGESAARVRSAAPAQPVAPTPPEVLTSPEVPTPLAKVPPGRTRWTSPGSPLQPRAAFAPPAPPPRAPASRRPERSDPLAAPSAPEAPPGHPTDRAPTLPRHSASAGRRQRRIRWPVGCKHRPPTARSRCLWQGSSPCRTLPARCSPPPCEALATPQQATTEKRASAATAPSSIPWATEAPCPHPCRRPSEDGWRKRRRGCLAQACTRAPQPQPPTPRACNAPAWAPA